MTSPSDRLTDPDLTAPADDPALGLDMTGGASPSDGGQATIAPAEATKGKGCGCLPRWLAWTLLLAIGGFALFSGGCLDACTHTNQVRRAPKVHGRVLDGRTGEPLAGVQLQRWLERAFIMGPGGGENTIVDGSRVRVTSGSDGRFEFPGWMGLRGIKSVQWFAYKPGYMPGAGFYATEDDPGGLPVQKRRGWEDPWVKVDFERTRKGAQMTLRLFPPTLEGVTLMTFDAGVGRFRPRPPDARDKDVWGEYFHRLRWRAQEGLIPWDDVVRQAVAHVRASGPIGEIGAQALSDIAGEVSDPRQRAEVVDAVHAYLAQHPETEAGKRFLADQARIPFEKRLAEREPMWDHLEGDAMRLPFPSVVAHAYVKGVDVLLKRLGRRYEQITSLDRPPGDLPGGFRVALVPTGELAAVDESHASRETLRRFVERGGTLVVMAQLTAGDYARIPTPQGQRLKVYGYDQAQGATADSIVVAADHPITCSAPRGPLSLAADGFIDEWPAGGQVLLRRAGDGTAAMVAYSVGAGWVVVTALHEEMALGEGRSSPAGVELLANLLSWAEGPAMPRAECVVGAPCTAAARIPVTNGTKYRTDRIVWRVYDPLNPKEQLATSEQPLRVEGGGSTSVALRLRLPKPVERPGILHVSYRLLDSTFRTKDSPLGAAPLTVVAEPLAAEIVVSRKQPPIEAPPFGLGLATEESYQLPGLDRVPVHLSLRSFGTNGFKGTVRISYGNRNRQRWVAAGSWDVTVPPGGAVFDNRTLGPIRFGTVTAADTWLRAEAVPQGASEPVARSEMFIRRRTTDRDPNSRR